MSHLFAWHHHHHRKIRRINVAITLSPGQSVTLTATADRNDNSTDDSAAITWQESVSGIVTVTDHGTSAGVSSATFTYASPGDVEITAVGTDGSTVVSTGTDNPDTITCVAPAPTLASVNIVEGAVA